MTALRHATLIGGNGFIGRCVQARLQRDGWRCWIPQRDDAQLWQRDLGHVLYCAGLTADFAARPFAAVEAHASLLNRVLHGAQFDSLVYLSSTRLYDGLGDVQASEDLPLALSPNNPRHLYDLSKALGESMCVAASGGRARVARLSCVWSEQADAAGFLPELLCRVMAARRADRAGPAPRLHVDSSAQFERDYVHIDDVVDALIALLQGGASKIYNVAGGRNIANAQLFERLGAAAGCSIVATQTHMQTHTQPAAPPPRVCISRIAGEFGWRPRDTLARLTQIVEQEPACSSS